MGETVLPGVILVQPGHTCANSKRCELPITDIGYAGEIRNLILDEASAEAETRRVERLAVGVNADIC